MFAFASFMMHLSASTQSVTIPDNFKGNRIYIQAPLEVDRIDNWAPNYLTVIDNYNNEMLNSVPSSLKVLSVITEINGISTKGMSKEEFDKIFCNYESVTLKYFTKTKGENLEYVSEIKKNKGFFLCGGWSWHIRIPRGIYNDKDVDYFQYYTFDFILNENLDRLEQLQLLSKSAEALESIGMKRDTTQPDVYLYVTLQSDERIETVYQPRQVTTSRTNANVSFNSRYNKANGSTRTRTITEDRGQFVTNVSTDAYLQVTILDAKKMDQSIPPKVWQFTFSQHVDYSMSLRDYIKKCSDYVPLYPFGENSTKIWYERYLGEVSFYGLFVMESLPGKWIVSGISPQIINKTDGIAIGDVLEIEIGNVRKKSFVLELPNGYVLLKKIGRKKISKSLLNNIISTRTGEKYKFIWSNHDVFYHDKLKGIDYF